MRAKLITLPTLFLMLFLATGCDEGGNASGVDSSRITACSLQRAGDLSLRFEGPGAGEACDEWAEASAQRSEYYTRYTDEDSGPARLGCAFKEGDLHVEVLVTSEGILAGVEAEDACSSFLRMGWTEDLAPLEELRERARLDETREQQRRALENARHEKRERLEHAREDALNAEWEEIGCGGFDIELSKAEEQRCDELAGIDE